MNGKRMTAFMLAAMLGTALPVTAWGAWHENNPLVAHALGESDGKIETNSKEAFLESWGSGFRALEVDLTYTSDGTLVARHDFEKDGSYYRLEQEAKAPLVMDSNAYQNSKIVYEQTPMTAADLLNLMAEYPDAYLITDTKDTDKDTVTKQFTDLKNLAQNMEIPQVLERIVPQIYNKEMYDWVKGIHPFTDWIYTLYLDTNPKYEEIAAFCQEKGIGTVTMQKDRVTKEIVDTLHGKGILVYAHTVNRYVQFKELRDMGVDGIYTDRIKPYELEWVGLQNSRKTEEKTVLVDGKETAFTTYPIFGEAHVPLRQLAEKTRKFSAEYDKAAKTMTLTEGKLFTGLGNELLLDSSDRLITEKADFTLIYGNKPTEITPFLVDGEVYVPLEKMLTVMGMGAEPSK